MGLGDLLPWLTGSGGCIAAMAFGYWLIIFSGRYVGRSEHKLVLDQVDTLVAQNAKLVEANDILTKAASDSRDQLQRVTSRDQLSNQLVAAVIQLAGGKPPSVQPLAVPMSPIQEPSI